MNLISAINRLSLAPFKPLQLVRNVSTSNALLFRTTPCLFAEPLKKKKKMDPALIKAKEERKKKKLEKQIRRLEKNARQLKPIGECQISEELRENKQLYTRTNVILSSEVIEQRALREKKWARYKRDQHLADIQMLDRIAFSQQRALDELRNESEELYQEAVQIDTFLLPFKCSGPVVTPAKPDYESPDGDYLDVSKKW